MHKLFPKEGIGVKNPPQLIVQGQFILVSNQKYHKKKKLNIPYELYVKILNKIAIWIQQYKKGLYTSIKKDLCTISGIYPRNV